MSEHVESSERKSQYLKVIPARRGKGPCSANGTRVLTEDGTELTGITRVELFADVSGVWRGVVHFIPVDVPDLIFDAAEPSGDVPIGRADVAALLVAIQAQTEAITRLAQSNAMLVQAMAEADDDGEGLTGGQYLDGRPK